MSAKSRPIFRSIPEADRIPFGQKLAFAAGGSMSWLAVDLTTGAHVMPFFNIGLGLNPIHLGFVLMALRLIDAFLDPVVGTLSDNTRTRWGRRRPYMLIGTVLTAATYFLLWRPSESLGATGILIYLACVGLLFYSSATLFSNPFCSMQMELTPNYDERTRLMAWTALFSKSFNLLGGWSLAIITSSIFTNAATGKPDFVKGMQGYSLLVFALILILGLLPTLLGRERYYDKKVSQQKKEPFLKSLKETFQVRPLWILIGVSFLLMLSTVSVNSLFLYINIYYVNEGDIAKASIVNGWKATVIVVTGIATIPLWTWLGERFDKQRIMFAMVGAAIIGHLLYIVCLRRDMPYLLILPAAFEIGTISALWIFIPSMKADVADFDELQTFKRREGSLNSVYSWFFKAASTIAVGLGGIVLSATGFDAKLPAQTPEALNRMTWTFIVLPVIFMGLMLVCLVRYSLNRGRMAEIREMLESRRGRL